MRLIFYGVLLILCSCHSEKSRLGIATKVTDKSELGHLVGLWTPTTITITTLKNLKYKTADMQLSLKADSTFSGTSIPDCITTESGEPANGIVANGVGTWEIYQAGEFWKLRLDFNKGPVFDEKTFLDFDITTTDAGLVVSEFLGDPDSMNVLEFEKSR